MNNVFKFYNSDRCEDCIVVAADFHAALTRWKEHERSRQVCERSLERVNSGRDPAWQVDDDPWPTSIELMGCIPVLCDCEERS